MEEELSTGAPKSQALFPGNQNIEILEDGKTAKDFRDSKILELDSGESQLPFYVLSLEAILKSHLRWTTNLPRVKPFYAVKCNNTPVVISMLTALGTGFDCASKGEIQLVSSFGVTPDRIIYAHPTKPSYHLTYARSQGVDVMTFDNEEELLKISRFHAEAKLVLRIAVNDSKSMLKLSKKFGAKPSLAGKLLERAAQLELQVIGVSFHVGCLCTDGLAYREAIAESRLIFDNATQMGFKMTLLDIGGGFTGIGDSFEEFSAIINKALDEFFPPESGVKLIAEPGRFYVESAFTLAVNVIAKRTIMHETGDDTESVPEKRMEYYINDGVYGSLSCVALDPQSINLQPYRHRAVESDEPKYKTTIWGPTCDSVDKVLEDLWFPELRVGDWLIMENTGAYTTSSTSSFNGFEKAFIHPVVTAEAHNRIHSHCQHKA